MESEIRAALLESFAPGELTVWPPGGLYTILAEAMIRKSDLERAEALSEKALDALRSSRKRKSLMRLSIKATFRERLEALESKREAVTQS